VNRVAKWTVFVYMAADCYKGGHFLAEPMFDDLLEMKEIGSSEDVNICAFFDGPLLADNFFARLNKGTPVEEDILVQFWQVNSNDPKILKTMVTNTVAMFPAERKLLVLSGHGRGWWGALRDDSTWKKYHDGGKIVLPADSVSCAGQIFSCREENFALIRSRFRPDEEYRGSKFDIIALDACNMGCVEAIQNLVPHADILIASEDREPGTGYPYDWVLNHLRSDPSVETAEFARRLVKEVGKYYRTSSSSGAVAITQVALRSDKFADFCEKVGNLAEEMTHYLGQGGLSVINDCQENACHFDKDIREYVDLKGLALLLADAPVPEKLRKSAEELIDYFDSSGFIIASEVDGGRYSANGLSIYAPPAEKLDLKYWEVVAGLPSSLGKWARFLKAYYKS
jgi:hypothetical protein